jgi:ABC-type multidrug transport system fused ATPase/permease subunit
VLDHNCIAFLALSPHFCRILVLDAGKIAEFDTPQNLLADKKSVFYGMAKDAGLAE